MFPSERQTRTSVKFIDASNNFVLSPISPRRRVHGALKNSKLNYPRSLINTLFWFPRRAISLGRINISQISRTNLPPSSNDGIIVVVVDVVVFVFVESLAEVFIWAIRDQIDDEGRGVWKFHPGELS